MEKEIRLLGGSELRAGGDSRKIEGRSIVFNSLSQDFGGWKEEISPDAINDEIINASDVTPKWFNKGVDAAILAPTAVNQQKFYLEYMGFRDYSKVPKVAAKQLFSMVGYSKMDLGIVKYHFEVGAGRENFEWL